MLQCNGIARRALSLPLLGLFLANAFADDKYVKSKEPVFPAVQPDRALVYFARPDFMRLLPLSTFKVFVDGTPAGWLPQRSYLAAHVEPGRRMVWGTARSSGQRFDFLGGRTYLLLLVESYGPPNRTLHETSWLAGDAADIRLLVADKKLSYVSPTEDAVARLRAEAEKELEKESKRNPDPVAAALPATFETVWYRPGKRGFSMKAYDATGTLTVSRETIEFKSDQKTLVISVGDVQSVSLDKITSSMNLADPNLWGIVTLAVSGATEVAAFRDGHDMGSGGDTERIYMTLRSAAQASQTSSSVSAVVAPPPSSPAEPLPETAAGLPEGFVLFEGMKDQFTIALPEGWMAYDQDRLVKGAPGRFGLVYFLPSEVLGAETGKLASAEVIRGMDTGETASFFLQRQPADEGMSCSGFSPKAEAKLVKLISGDSVFRKTATVTEPPHAAPAPVAGCRGLRIRGSSQLPGGPSWVTDVHMASDGQTLYILSLRNHTGNYNKNVEVFQKAIATAKLTATK